MQDTCSANVYRIFLPDVLIEGRECCCGRLVRGKEKGGTRQKMGLFINSQPTV